MDVVVGVGAAVAVAPDADDGLGVAVDCAGAGAGAGVAVPDLGVGVGVAVPDTGVDASPVAIAVVLGVNVAVAWLVGLAPDVAVALAANKFCGSDGSNVDVLLLTATDVQPVMSSARAVKHNRRFKIYHLVSRY